MKTIERAGGLVGEARVHELFVDARKTSTAECYSAKTEAEPADPAYQKVFGGGANDGTTP
jgi:hypothetical protein